MPNTAATASSVGTASYEVVGPPDARVVVALGGISALRHTRLWWGTVVCDNGHIDTTRFRVLGLDWLDGGEGSDERPERVVTTHDQADAIVAALDELGVERTHALVGASYGGMVALAFAERYPTRVERLIVISAPAEAHPMSTALRSLQRRIVELGLATGRSFEALAIARGLAMTTYRSAAEFAGRFPSAPVAAASSDARFEVERYLEHAGAKFARAFTPARFLALSLSADLHRVDPAAIHVPAFLIAARGDTVVPREQMADLAARWGGDSCFVETPTRTGHDAFLAEPDVAGRFIAHALTHSALA